jgi:pyruvate/2-oxoglutarate dehydrogenase complex dihydrolipoamide acyltransferase (E2) component
MSVEVRLPQFGMGMQEAIIVKWLKNEGDAVAEGEALIEIEAAKTSEIVESPAAGRLGKILVPEGETVPVRELLAEIEID